MGGAIALYSVLVIAALKVVAAFPAASVASMATFVMAVVRATGAVAT